MNKTEEEFLEENIFQLLTYYLNSINKNKKILVLQCVKNFHRFLVPVTTTYQGGYYYKADTVLDILSDLNISEDSVKYELIIDKLLTYYYSLFIKCIDERKEILQLMEKNKIKEIIINPIIFTCHCDILFSKNLRTLDLHTEESLRNFLSDERIIVKIYKEDKKFLILDEKRSGLIIIGSFGSVRKEFRKKLFKYISEQPNSRQLEKEIFGKKIPEREKLIYLMED